MVYLFGIAAIFSTLLGGFLALKHRDRLHTILGFSAGAVIGVAFFDLMPEAFSLGSDQYGPSTISAVLAAGFLFYMLLSRLLLLHPSAHEADHGDQRNAHFGASSLSIHSFIDGLGIGFAFQISGALGLVVAAAVLAHDFFDGLNTVSFIIKHRGERGTAVGWLVVDAIAPLVGIFTTRFFALSDAQLGLVLALFCGFFLYIGASDLVPESQHQHPKLVTSLMTLAGAAAIYLVIRIAGA